MRARASSKDRATRRCTSRFRAPNCQAHSGGFRVSAGCARLQKGLGVGPAGCSAQPEWLVAGDPSGASSDRTQGQVRASSGCGGPSCRGVLLQLDYSLTISIIKKPLPRPPLNLPWSIAPFCPSLCTNRSFTAACTRTFIPAKQQSPLHVSLAHTMFVWGARDFTTFCNHRGTHF